MKFIFIYGPPAVGKLTVARELSKLTGYSILHNQLTLDLLASVFPWGSKPFGKLNEQFRLDIIRETCRAKLPGLIHTFCYGRGHDEGYYRKIFRVVEGSGGKVCLVQLVCDLDVLMERVARPGRKKHRKITTKKVMRAVLNKFDLLSPVPFRKSLTIDNTQVTASKAARVITDHFRLCRKNRG